MVHRLPSPAGHAENQTVEIAHEALLGGWARLRVWVDAANEDLRTARRLAVAATDWRDSDRDASFLATGGKLDRFEAWRTRSGLPVSAEEDEFLSASSAEQRRRVASQRSRHDRELGCSAGRGAACADRHPDRRLRHGGRSVGCADRAQAH